MLEKCPLGIGFSCSECDAIQYSCHPLHYKLKHDVKDRLQKLVADLELALKEPSNNWKANRLNLEHVYYELKEITELRF